MRERILVWWSYSDLVVKAFYVFIIQNIFKRLVSAVERHSYRDYAVKIRNRSGSAYRTYKIFTKSIYFANIELEQSIICYMNKPLHLVSRSSVLIV